MLSPFDSPMGNSFVRMMAETKVFEQQGGQYNPNDGDTSCFSLSADKFSSLSKKYTSPNGGYWLYQYTNYNNKGVAVFER